MDLMLELELVGRLILAAFLGFVIGLEREIAGQPAGDRTHAMASLGIATCKRSIGEQQRPGRPYPY